MTDDLTPEALVASFRAGACGYDDRCRDMRAESGCSCAQAADTITALLLENEALTAESREALLDFRRQTKRAEAAEAKAIDWRDRATAAEAEVNDLRTKYEILDGGYRALVSRCKKEVARAEKAEAERDAAMAGAVRVKPGVAERAVWSAMIWAAENSDGWRDAIEYTDGGNSFAEGEARATVRRIRAALEPHPAALEWAVMIDRRALVKAAALARHSEACDGGWSVVGLPAAEAAVDAILATLEPNPAAQDREALIAAMLADIAQRADDAADQYERQGNAHAALALRLQATGIRSLATQPQTDALAAVQREARAEGMRMAAKIAVPEERSAVGQQSEFAEGTRHAGWRINKAILAVAKREAGHD